VLFVSVKEWIKIVVIFFIVNVINNASFKFNIAMPLYMIFRSGSLAASLITEKLILGRQHSTLKHLAVTLITLGIMMYTYASSKQVPENISIFDWITDVKGNKAKFMQVNHPKFICLRSFIIKKVGNRKN